MKVTKTCLHCNTLFTRYKSQGNKFCSRACNGEFQKNKTRELYKSTCEVCGVEFLPKRPRDGGRFCSYSCSGINSRKDRVDRNGYWYVFRPERREKNLQGYVPEHHLVMEDILGHELAAGMVVHHIDGIKKNNSRNNLLYMGDSDHKRIHANGVAEKLKEFLIDADGRHAAAVSGNELYNNFLRLNHDNVK